MNFQEVQPIVGAWDDVLEELEDVQPEGKTQPCVFEPKRLKSQGRIVLLFRQL